MAVVEARVQPRHAGKVDGQFADTAAHITPLGVEASRKRRPTRSACGFPPAPGEKRPKAAIDRFPLRGMTRESDRADAAAVLHRRHVGIDAGGDFSSAVRTCGVARSIRRGAASRGECRKRLSIIEGVVTSTSENRPE